MTVFEAARAHMIESQLRPNKVGDARVLAVLATIRRELFVPDRFKPVAYIDEDLPLGANRFLMKPTIAGRLLQSAAIEVTDTVLMVGAGTGYEAALAARLARSVVVLEEDPDLARRARAALVEHSIASVSVVEGPLPLGYRQRAPYDVIFFCGAIADVPSEIAAQLGEGGRLLAVIRPANAVGRAMLTTRTGGVLARRGLFDASIPLLPAFLPKPAFVF
jgi:protein-L-isoaspartate(D-aspartate) O-methyltransferase